MKEYKIYAENSDGSLNWKTFLKEIEDRINNDEEIIAETRECNRLFFENLLKIVDNPENIEYIGGMVHSIENKIPKYSYIKNVEHEGKIYDVEIDELRRIFRVIEIQ